MKKSDLKQFNKRAFWIFAILVANTLGVFSQIKVSGTVTDSKKEPLIGVNVTVSGSKNGTITDFDGKFSL